jgi:uncharacterized membrane protein
MNYIDEYTEGEVFIAEFLKERRIKYQSQKKIENLIGDSKSFRLADFYLPEYKIYLEFFGLWNVTEEHKQAYKEKKNVYTNNQIPCIYFYPENLGIMDHLFDYRIQKELEAHHLKQELFKFRSWLFIEDRGGLFFWFVLSIILLLFTLETADPKLRIYYIVLLVGNMIWQLYRLFKGYKRFFKNDRSLNEPVY